ncbi:MAG: hypothetical protein OQK82_09385 [Candidatus Pacearchaeota archaeon]|nr:hypothetical protein [Candidatus Pacearchaeota archaeon]
MGSALNTGIFFLYLIISLYFINAPFDFVPLPAINNWTVFVGGILLLFGGIKYLKSEPEVLGIGVGNHQ